MRKTSTKHDRSDKVQSAQDIVKLAKRAVRNQDYRAAAQARSRVANDLKADIMSEVKGAVKKYVKIYVDRVQTAIKRVRQLDEGHNEVRVEIELGDGDLATYPEQDFEDAGLTSDDVAELIAQEFEAQLQEPIQNLSEESGDYWKNIVLDGIEDVSFDPGVPDDADAEFTGTLVIDVIIEPWGDAEEEEFDEEEKEEYEDES